MLCMRWLAIKAALGFSSLAIWPQRDLMANWAVAAAVALAFKYGSNLILTGDVTGDLVLVPREGVCGTLVGDDGMGWRLTLTGDANGDLVFISGEGISGKISSPGGDRMICTLGGLEKSSASILLSNLALSLWIEDDSSTQVWELAGLEERVESVLVDPPMDIWLLVWLQVTMMSTNGHECWQSLKDLGSLKDL